MTITTEKAIRLQIGEDKEFQGTKVHVAGYPFSNYWGRAVRYEIDSHTDLLLHESPYNQERTWIVYKFYSQTQAKTRETKKCPSKYQEIGRKLTMILEEVFCEEEVEETQTCSCGKSIPPDEWICVDCKTKQNSLSE